MIIFLDYSRKVCINGVLSRIDKYEGKVRDDLSDGCIETFDPEFLKWVWDFPEKYRPEIIETLKNTDKLVVILKNRQQAKVLFRNIHNLYGWNPHAYTECPMTVIWDNQGETATVHALVVTNDGEGPLMRIVSAGFNENEFFGMGVEGV
jgi:hypothetical protein